jgi:plasmid stabilization system protein ParE
MQLVTRPQFYLDVAEEVEYLARKAGAETAQRWSEAVDRTVETLLRHPKLGRTRHDLRPDGIRSWRVKRFSRWLVFFRVREEEKALVLLRVRSGTMNLVVLEMES